MDVFRKTKTLSLIAGLTLVLAACGGGSDSAGTGAVSAPAQAPAANVTDMDSAQYLIGNVGDRIFFETDKAVLDMAARDTLTAQARWLQQDMAVRLTIEGHADERGTREYNLALGARRASSVRNFLISQGVSADRLQTISYGKERPVSLCANENCWSKNRRAVSTIR